ncbi:aroma-sacti cluster domain-containing protein [Streptomyces sp. NBC_01262]|jgi:predicted nucleotide-binding protein (sugar kinase/HSP70/actin superfamily)|uniref:aroma-sacti cluster domain-containing protein n=1 Tax=Streptomyces sp. NBC_01262 TaxID=2903803 RepID=UPI002E36E874|nr:aroma-sacti cluster domain-containing protein [Streptomyces sp. NBC_01262]
MSHEPLEALRSAGTPVDLLSASEREVFASLSPDEVSVLGSIQTRLNAVAAAVEGQVADSNTNVVC